ncbi:poly(U)-specific 3'-to-5' RNA exonuclease [Linnemannia hyalina]|uniref:U6 snRNA phosphodiesterase 1 n=1 Tax=Linnemannia hyalina TaxID=64524 RepID=A0A9P7XXV5_9FUNG|nr:poly(U)-specific 3'-to-5' RNA exonuclease [Linnemannia hyalina]
MPLVDYGSSSDEDENEIQGSSATANLYKDRERPPDNPDRHQGRIRARAHVDGSWPVHVYLEAPSTISMLQSVESLKKKGDAPVEAESAEDATELHISLTRPIFKVNFSGVQSFSNDDQTRSFLSLRVGAGHAQLESLVAEMDKIAQRYSQPKFYPDPQFHASFAWALGGGMLNSGVVESMSELNGELGHDLRHCSVGVKKVNWKIGQKTGSVELLVE